MDSPANDDAPGFAPDEPKDGRSSGDWNTRYSEAAARNAIRFEAWYLAAHLIAFLILTALSAVNLNYFGLPALAWGGLKPLALTWLGGLGGGTIFAIKWLYHSVAKNIWNIDRRLWRLFTPHLSATLALAVAMLISSQLLTFVNHDVLKVDTACVAIGFVVGYSSDTAIAKLIEVAETLFGTHSHHL